MGVGAFVPVQVAVQIYHITDFQFFDLLIDIGIRTAQIGFYGKAVGLTIQGNVEIKIIAFRTGAVPVIHISVFTAFGGRLYGQSLKSHILVLIIDQIIGAQFIRDIHGIRDIGTFFDLELAFRDLGFTGPFRLIACHLDLGAGRQLSILLFRTGHIKKEISAVRVLGIEGSLSLAGIFPPALFGLDVGLDDDFRIQFGSHVLFIGHDAFPFFGISFVFCLRNGRFRVTGAARGGTAAGGQSKNHCHGYQQCEFLFHNLSPSGGYGRLFVCRVLAGPLSL